MYILFEITGKIYLEINHQIFFMLNKNLMILIYAYQKEPAHGGAEHVPLVEGEGPSELAHPASAARRLLLRLGRADGAVAGIAGIQICTCETSLV